MSLPERYCEQIRRLVDTVEDPTVADIIFVASAQPSPRRPRRVGMLVGVALAVAILVSAMVMLAGQGSSTHRARIQPAQTPTVPEACVVDNSNRNGCTMSPTAASAYLGFDARVPAGIPAGWTPERTRLLVYRQPLPDGEPPLPAGVESVPVYNQIWTPPGTDLNATGTCPSRLQVRERPVLPGESTGTGAAIDVGNGRTIYGSLAESSTCSGQPTVNTMLNWIENGVSFTVNAEDVDREQVLQVVASLQQS